MTQAAHQRQYAFRTAAAVALGALLLPAAACRSTTQDEPADLPSGHLEVRGAAGEVLFALRRKPYGFRMVDASAGRLARITFDAGGVTLTETPDSPLRIVGQGDDLDLVGTGGPVLRMRRVDGALRLVDRAAVPVGRVRIEGEEAVTYDAGGTPVARARVSGGRIVLTTRDGGALGFVTGDVAFERAAVAFLPALTPVQRAAFLAWPAAASQGRAPPSRG